MWRKLERQQLDKESSVECNSTHKPPLLDILVEVLSIPACKQYSTQWTNSLLQSEGERSCCNWSLVLRASHHCQQHYLGRDEAHGSDGYLISARQHSKFKVAWCYAVRVISWQEYFETLRLAPLQSLLKRLFPLIPLHVLSHRAAIHVKSALCFHLLFQQLNRERPLAGLLPITVEVDRFRLFRCFIFQLHLLHMSYCGSHIKLLHITSV